MAPVDDDFSDSEDESFDDVQTSVLLGVPDGVVEAQSDLLDPMVSRVGGAPAFVTAKPPALDVSNCGHCGDPMPMLVQLWCPFEDSPMDRALYVWGEPKRSVRAWRAVKHNAKYAEKLKRKQERRAAEAAAKAPVKAPAVPAVNPFSAPQSSEASKSGLGDLIFGDDGFGDGDDVGDSANPPADDSESESGDEDDEDDVDIAAAAVEQLSLDPDSRTPWSSTAAAYQPVYLKTISEYVPPAHVDPQPAGPAPTPPAGDDKDLKWAMEAYEQSLKTDHVFERFTQRLTADDEQCIRYDLGGTPLPFQTDAVYEQLFPAPRASATILKGPLAPPLKRTFEPAVLPACSACGAARVFEAQLVPNLINILRRPSQGPRTAIPQTDEERRAEVAKILSREEGAGMEWGTAMVFACAKDCCDVQEAWREEHVLVQWDD